MASAPTDHRVDHVVIGAGVVGAAAAHALSARGDRVLLVEQHARGHDRGSSHGGSRIFRLGYADPEYVALAQRALAGWTALEQTTGRTLLDRTGAVDHGDPDTVHAIAATLAAAHVPHEVLSPADAAERWPGLVFEGTVLTHPDAGRIRAAAAVETFLELAAQQGASLRFDAHVIGIEPDADGVSVALADGTAVRARSVVVAAGSWVPTLVGDLLRGLGAGLPAVTVTEEQPAHFPGHLPDDAWPSFLHHRRDAPPVYGLCTPGEGVKVGFHGTGAVVHPDDRDRTPVSEDLAALTAYVERWVPGVDATAPAPISCLYDSTPDEDFVLDRVGPVTVATGFSGHGFKFAPVLGELLADLAQGGRAVPRFAFRA